MEARGKISLTANNLSHSVQRILDFISIFNFERFFLKSKKIHGQLKLLLFLPAGGSIFLSTSRSSCFKKKTTLPQANPIDRLVQALRADARIVSSSWLAVLGLAQLGQLGCLIRFSLTWSVGLPN